MNGFMLENTLSFKIFLLNYSYPFKDPFKKSNLEMDQRMM